MKNFLSQFTHYYFVFPPINNDRIRRQQGAFVICPPGKTASWSMATMAKGLAQEIYRIRINASGKKKMLTELKQLGVTRSYIFPELAVLAADTKLRYPARVDGA